MTSTDADILVLGPGKTPAAAMGRRGERVVLVGRSAPMRRRH
jgi:hypothetical protein